MQDLGLNLFYAFVAELFTIIVAALIQGDERKKITVFLFGTLIAGIIGYSNVIFEMVGVSLPRNNDCRAWNLASDIRVYPSQENPNRDSCGNSDIWYFLGSTTLERIPADYSLLVNFVADAFGIPGYQQWQGDLILQKDLENIRLPLVGINTTDKMKTIDTAIHPSKSIAVHPAGVTSLVIIGWKSPINGTVSISGFVNDLDSNGGDGILWYIDKENQSLASGSFSNGGRQAFLDSADAENLSEVIVSKGEFVYLVIHPNSDDLYDTTWVDIQLTLR